MYGYRLAIELRLSNDLMKSCPSQVRGYVDEHPETEPLLACTQR